MIKFTYTPTVDDYIAFEKFKYRRNKASFIIIFFCAAFIAMGFYDVFLSKNYIMLISALATAIISFGIFFYQTKIMPEKNVKKMILKDINYLTPNEVTVSDKTVEINNIPKPNQLGIVSVYPYSIMNVIYETEEAFYFFLGTEVKLLPKRAIPDEFKENAEKIIRKNKNYIFMK